MLPVLQSFTPERETDTETNIIIQRAKRFKTKARGAWPPERTKSIPAREDILEISRHDPPTELPLDGFTFHFQLFYLRNRYPRALRADGRMYKYCFAPSSCFLFQE